MLNIASLAMVLLATARPVTDTTITVKAGTRLVVDNFAGAIVVDTWNNKNAIRVQAEHSRRALLDVEHGVARLDLSVHGKWGEPTFADFTITVPAGTPVELSGVDTDIAVRGSEGVVKAETVKGDVSIHGAKGPVSCSSVEGEVVIEDCEGRIEASAVNEHVRVVGARGAVQAESVNGDVFLEQLKSTNVEGSTVNGNVYYLGEIERNGDYSFSTHNGNLLIGVSESADCTGSVSTYAGSFSSSFPIEKSSKRKDDNDFTFTIGDGSAALELEAFNGSIRLERPNEVAQKIASANAKRDAHARAHKDMKAYEKKQEQLERKMEQKERELERKLEQKERERERAEQLKEKQAEDDDDKGPDSHPDDEN